MKQSNFSISNNWNATSENLWSHFVWTLGGNLTSQPRRAYIVNFRPASMIDVERKNDYDHGKAGFQKSSMKGQVHGTGSPNE
jgi:hypothetical protein